MPCLDSLGAWSVVDLDSLRTITMQDLNEDKHCRTLRLAQRRRLMHQLKKRGRRKPPPPPPPVGGALGNALWGALADLLPGRQRLALEGGPSQPGRRRRADGTRPLPRAAEDDEPAEDEDEEDDVVDDDEGQQERDELRKRKKI